LSEITTQITDHCLELISKQAQKALDTAPDYLTALADQTSYSEERTLYLDTMHELSFARKKVTDKFNSEMLKPFEVLSTGEIPEEFKRKGGVILNVTGADDLEEKLALETMLNKSHAKAELTLHNVERSLNAIMGDDWVKRHYNPIDPEYIIRAWVSAVHEMDLTAKGNLAMYGVLDSQLLNKLSAIYETVGKFVESLPRSRRKHLDEAKQSSRDQSSSAADEREDFETMFGDIDSTQPDINFTSQGLEQDYDDNEEPPEAIRTESLLGVLERLQHDRTLDNSDYYSSSYLLDSRKLLEDSHATPEGVINPWTVGQINDDVIDMSRLMFSFIMDDYNLPDDIRFHVSRLQIPYLKLGLNDKTMFQSREHPARLLLMNLTQSIDAWDPSHSGGLDMLLEEVIRVIDEILATYKSNSNVFALIQKRFSAFLNGESHVDEGLQERKKTRETQTARADNAKLYIEATLSDICDDKRIPPIIEKILSDYWSKVLFLEYLKDGEDTEAYQTLLETTHILVDSVQEKFSEQSRKEMAKSLPGLIKRVKQGLNTISVASFESVDLFRELQQCHMEVLKERPETHESAEFEVSDDEYDEFREQSSQQVWNRDMIEASMLEENIERSISMSNSDPYAFEDNPNIIKDHNNDLQDATVAKAARERQIIDDELKEAREAYEKALEDHKQKKQQEVALSDKGSEEDDGDDFMSMFFSDPEFEQKQSAALRNGDESKTSEKSATNADEMDEFGSELDLDLLTDLDNNNVEVNDDEIDSLFADSDDNIMSETSSDKLIKDAEELEDISSEPYADLDTQDVEEIELAAFVEPNTSEQSPAQSTEQEMMLKGRAKGALDDDNANQSTSDELGHDIVEELIERLKVGLWVDLYHADGQKVRAKIMAIVPTVGKYIFGDRSGKKLADFNRKSLHEAIQSRRIIISEEDTVYDKTLESVIANLRVMKKAEDD